jgi:tetratricopeptide (TPR) repeat protein
VARSISKGSPDPKQSAGAINVRSAMLFTRKNDRMFTARFRKAWFALIILASMFVAADDALAQAAQALFEKAFELMKKGDHETAETFLRMGLEKEPENALGHYYLAEVMVRLNKPRKDAIVQYRAAARLSPESKEGLDALAKSIRLEKAEEAVKSSKQAIISVLPQTLRGRSVRWTGEDEKIGVCVSMNSWEYQFDENKEFKKQNFTVSLQRFIPGRSVSPKSLHKYSGAWQKKFDDYSLIFKAENPRESIAPPWFATAGQFSIEIRLYKGEPWFDLHTTGLNGGIVWLPIAQCLQ